MTRHARSRTAPRHLLALLAYAVLTADACGGRTNVTVHPSVPPRTQTTLSADIEAALSDPALSRGTWGIAIRSLDRHETLYEHNADKLMMPASTLKVVTLAVAAEQLGWDFSYSTRLVAHGSIDSGTLHGDLIIIGAGDPSVDDWDGVASLRFKEWATALHRAGIDAVTGRVIGDDNVFDDDDLGNGWAWDDVAASYSAGVSGLQFNENSAQLVIAPTMVGDPPLLEVRPLSASVSVANRALTAPIGPPLQVRQLPRSAQMEVVGTVPSANGVIVRNVSVANPTIYFAQAVRMALIGEGIDIGGPAVDADDLTERPELYQTTPIAELRSAPLGTLAATMMSLSQNLFAESLLKTLGTRSALPGSAAGGRGLIAAQLSAWGIVPQDTFIVDGSGLSRYNLIAPKAQVTVLEHVYDDPRLRDPFLAALPMAGATGTLERRMTGTPAAGNARAKTGSFSNARGLAGFVKTAEGEMLAFSILANNYNASSALIDHATDTIVSTLARFQRQQRGSAPLGDSRQR